MTRKMWLVAAGAGIAATGLVGLALPAVAGGVAGGVAAAIAPAATVAYAGQHGPADNGQAGYGQVGYGQAGYAQAGQAGNGQVDAGPAGTSECATCTAEPGSGDLSDLGALGAADLQTWVEEEKVAYDLYTAFAEQYDSTRFERIASSEAAHIEAVRTLLATYGLSDPSAGEPAGEFTDPHLAELYATLLAQGSASYDDALAVGRAVELDDIALLERATDDVSAADVEQVLGQQLSASERHLRAFGG